MSRYVPIILLAVVFTAGCKSYSRYAIDSTASVPVDTNLLGMWRCVEDTDKANFIEVENYHDIYGDMEKRYGSIENYLAARIGERQKDVDRGDWNSAGDSYIDNLRWTVNNKNGLYWLTYFDYHGQNPHYEAWSAYFSSVNKKPFLNLGYWNQTPDHKMEEGYLLLRIIKMARDTVVTAIVADKTMKNLQSNKDVRSRVTARLNDKQFYSDTMHFYKIHKYHGSFKIATKLANPK